MLVGCSQVKHNTELEKSIQSIIKDKSKSEININSLADFDWDKAFLIMPYSNQESIKDQLGVEFQDPSNMESRDDIFLLVFLNGDDVVQYAELNREQSDFSIGEKEYLTPSDAWISIRRN
jgi:hypothetical protein